jgi:rifampicin phosphotransferase
MNFVSDISPANEQSHIGGKAKNLLLLKSMGYQVPRFAVISVEQLNALLPVNEGGKSKSEQINEATIPGAWITDLVAYLAGTRFFAVRSSAMDEDGQTSSFAGQFESHLFVKPEQLTEKIRQVWASAYTDRVALYRKQQGTNENTGMAIIVQEMIDADVSGVAFGRHPLNGNKDQIVINSVYGLGEGLVSGVLNADSYLLENGNISQSLAEKTQKITADLASGGTLVAETESGLVSTSSLPSEFVHQLGAVLKHLEQVTDLPQDVEFAISNNKLFLLQTRPITRSHHKTTENFTLWDNSNIIESYPGITTPLTFSFISRSYEVAYRLFSEYLGVPPMVIQRHERVFAHTLGFINGRVYYNLRTWYHMLAMLPGYSLNARFMEKMMGVKEPFDVPESYKLSRGKAWWSIAKMSIRMIRRFIELPKKRAEFTDLLNHTIGEYQQIPYTAKSLSELAELYLNFEQKLLNEWKAPLLNDFFAMIAFGMLQKEAAKLNTENSNIHNDLLCGSSDIISVEPVRRTIALATEIGESADLRQLFHEHTPDEIWKKLTDAGQEPYLSIHQHIHRYITDFGERCVGELKLETISYTQDPAGFIRILKSYVENGVSQKKLNQNAEQTLRLAAEQKVNEALAGKPLSKWKFGKILSYARELVSARENLRYERTRAFGIVRLLFSQMGETMFRAGLLVEPSDVFYLTKEEILSFVEGTAVTQNISALAALRKSEFKKHRTLPVPAERFATYGAVYQGNDFFDSETLETQEGDLKGIGCSPGKVRARVRVVLHPAEVSDMQGDILVTTSTDPGWVMLFPSASGIIVERGSLLSHSAIVSREMGKPCIVGVTGLLKRLKTGNLIEMDGSTGYITMLDE